MDFGFKKVAHLIIYYLFNLVKGIGNKRLYLCVHITKLCKRWLLALQRNVLKYSRRLFIGPKFIEKPKVPSPK